MKATILSHSVTEFLDRHEAGLQLGRELKKTVKGDAVVLGIPRGGVVTAQAIASVLGCAMDIILAHKVRAPFNPELAIGAINEEGKMFLNNHRVWATESRWEYIEDEKRVQVEEMMRRRRLFRDAYPKIPLTGRTVIVTDDGVATGATVQVALWAARQEHPGRLIAAFPVAPPEALDELSGDADQVLCLKSPGEFNAISQFYACFEQVTDEDVLCILRGEYGHRQAEAL